jgi:SAM-dependent methyltransferase
MGGCWWRVKPCSALQGFTNPFGSLIGVRRQEEAFQMDPWETLHRWEWFRRRQWQASFRERRRTISTAVAAILHERGHADGLGLDCSCGLGLHTIAFMEAGLRVQGADRSAFAVSRAQELARNEGHHIPFFVASWHDLPTCTPQRFDAIFCDALSWLRTRHAFQEALQGLREALQPGGALLFLGAPEGTPDDRGAQLLQERWHAQPHYALDWSHTDGHVTCTKMSVGALGADFLDRHHVFLIEEAGAQRLECVTIRESAHWSWARLVALFHEAGFSHLSTYAVQQWSSRGMPAGLNVATR